MQRHTDGDRPTTERSARSGAAFRAPAPSPNYALPLHRIREMGFSHKLFDLLDERKFTKEELRQFFLLLFGPDKFDGVPDPHVDWKGFLTSINRLANAEKQQWNPIRKKMAPWVDVRKLNSTYGTDSCICM